jgi:glycosyltransferase involved in cell wall biosynthesis
MIEASTHRRIRVLELRSVRGTGGGPEKTILLGAGASAGRFDITVCYIRDHRDGVFELAARASDLGIRYVEVEERHSFDVRIWRQLRGIVADRRIDIVHAHEYKTDFLALLLASRLNAVPLATAHGWTGNTVRERYVYYPLDKRLLARFPAVVAVSSEIKAELVRHGARPDRVTVLLNSIDPMVFRRAVDQRAQVRQRLGFGQDDIVIGAVGRVERQKRFDVLLDAFASVAREQPRVRLVIAGDGSLLPDLKAQALAQNVTSHCVFLGHYRDIVTLHQALDVFVQSSEYEGTPNAVLEAMAMETPIVATDAGGTRELATPGLHALIVPSGDVRALRDAINAVLHDPAGASTRATAARRRVETHLSFEARTRHLERIYTDLVERRVAAEAREAGRSHV